MNREWGRIFYIGSFCLLTCLQFGCATAARERAFKEAVPAELLRIKIGITTEDEVIAVLGEPAWTTMLPTGGKRLKYSLSNTITRETVHQGKHNYLGAALTGGLLGVLLEKGARPEPVVERHKEEVKQPASVTIGQDGKVAALDPDPDEIRKTLYKR